MAGTSTEVILSAVSVVCMHLCLACNSAPTVTKASATVRRYDGAVVTREITDPAQLARLAGCFPHAGERRVVLLTSVSPWAASVDILFTRSDGSSFRVWTDLRYWSEGQGDHDVDSQCQMTITSIVGSPGDTSAASGPS